MIILALQNLNLKEKIITRSSTNVYNKSLLASIIANHGEEAKSFRIYKGLVDNFAYNQKGRDRDQIRAVAAGDADLQL